MAFNFHKMARNIKQCTEVKACCQLRQYMRYVSLDELGTVFPPYIQEEFMRRRTSN